LFYFDNSKYNNNDDDKRMRMTNREREDYIIF